MRSSLEQNQLERHAELPTGAERWARSTPRAGPGLVCFVNTCKHCRSSFGLQSTRQLHACCLMAHAGVWLRPPAVAGRHCAAESCSRQSSSLGTSTTGHSRLSWKCKATRGGSAESLQFTDAAEETRVATRAPQHDYTYPARLLSKNQVPPRCCHGRAHVSVCAYRERAAGHR